jgi:hypothetical protein
MIGLLAPADLAVKVARRSKEVWWSARSLLGQGHRSQDLVADLSNAKEAAP